MNLKNAYVVSHCEKIVCEFAAPTRLENNVNDFVLIPHAATHHIMQFLCFDDT